MGRPSAPVAGGLGGGGDTVGGADHDDGERVGLVELLGDALGLLQGHRLDVAVALFQVVDAEVLDLHAHEHAGDIVGAAAAQRKRAGEVALGGVQLIGGRYLLFHAPAPLADEVEGCADPRVLGRGADVDLVTLFVASEVPR